MRKDSVILDIQRKLKSQDLAIRKLNRTGGTKAGVTVYVSATAPTNPNVNDIWIQIS